MGGVSVLLSVLLVALSTAVFSEINSLSFGFTEPNYFVSGFSSSEHYEPLSTSGNSRLKMRLGIYYRIFALKEDRTGLYLSYTQNSFWKKPDPGSPFLDNNFRPELFAYLDILKWFKKSEELYFPKIKVTLSRESNWVGGINHRSWDRAIGGLEIGQFGKTEYYGSFGSWKVFSLSTNNKDIREYAGDAQIMIGYWYFDNSRIVKWGGCMDLRFRLNNQDITSIATSVYFNPLVQKNWKWIPTLMAEYYWGTGECLLNYKAHTNSVRFGVAFM